MTQIPHKIPRHTQTHHHGPYKANPQLHLRQTTILPNRTGQTLPTLIGRQYQPPQCPDMQQCYWCHLAHHLPQYLPLLPKMDIHCRHSNKPPSPWRNKINHRPEYVPTDMVPPHPRETCLWTPTHCPHLPLGNSPNTWKNRCLHGSTLEPHLEPTTHQSMHVWNPYKMLKWLKP